MKNKFMITITDLNGSRNFLLSQIIKKIALYLVLFVFTIFVTGALYIRYLGSKIDSLSQTKTELHQLNQKLRDNIEASRMEFEAIEGKIADLEHEFGLDPEADEREKVRMNLWSRSSQETAKLSSRIPISSWPTSPTRRRWLGHSSGVATRPRPSRSLQ